MTKEEDQSNRDGSCEQYPRLESFPSIGRADAQQNAEPGQVRLECPSPVLQKPFSPSETRTPMPGWPDSRRLLILVEDDEDDLMLFQRALQKAGVTCSVLCADEGTKAIEMLSRLGPEVASVCLVSDSQLSDMSGFDLLKRVRGMAPSISVKFAFLTGNTRPSIEGQANANGADAFFVKPCLFADLIGIARAIARLVACPS
jgi:CheY-like chemotaxis protein